jgi:hypothetical protein
MPYIALAVALMLLVVPLGATERSAALPASGSTLLAYDDETGRGWNGEDNGSDESDGPNAFSDDDDDNDEADDDSAHGPDDEWDVDEYERSERA